MWKRYEVELKFTTQFASSTPKNPKDIEAMLLARAPSDSALRRRIEEGEQITPLPELAEQVGEEVEATQEVERGYATFKRDEKGLYYEARCVRAHIKDCANVLQKLLSITALKSKVANRVYVEPAKIYLDKSEPDGNETRIVHAMTMKGPRSSLKTIDYVDKPVLKFTLKLMDDDVVDRDILEAIFEYGGEHGMGQERSQDWGKYKLVRLEEAK
ncbi:hypothetical protein ES705_24876 [subsurface metagenome]